MQTTPNMSLIKWDQVGDYFSHAQLASNWQLVDDHDHSPGKGKKIPFGGLGSGSVSSTELRADAVLTANIADGQVTKVKLDASVDYENAFSTWKAVAGWYGGYGVSGCLAGTHLLTAPQWGSASSGTSGNSTAIFYLNPADYAAGGRTVQYRIAAIASTNLVAPGHAPEVHLGIASPTIQPSGNPNRWGLATVSSVDFTGLITAAAQYVQLIGPAFTAPAAGFYALAGFFGLNTSAGSVVDLRACLQVRQV
jgi:hypothetical protein